MARDVRLLRTEAAEASAAGKHKRALAAYLELEQLEPRDAQWSKRAAETYRRLGKDKDAIGAFSRAADRYAQGGFLVQAIAVCKLIIQIEPKNDEALRRIALMNEQIGAGPTRAIAMAESNPNLASNAAVAALKSGSTGAMPVFRDPAPPARDKPESAPPPIAVPRTRTPQAVKPAPAANQIPPQPQGRLSPQELASSTDADMPVPVAMPRTKSKPVQMLPDQGIEAISLKTEVPDSFEREEASGIYVIPIDAHLEDIVEVDEGGGEYDLAEGSDASGSAPRIEMMEPDTSSPAIEVEDPDGYSVEPDEIDELELEDLEEIPLGEPRLVPAAAAQALSRTPLFAGLSQDALESLVQKLTLVHLSAKEVLFHEGDPGDALYVIVEGEVSVQAEGPPRVEMARLGPGAFIGEVALMTDQPRSATVSAVEDAELLRIDRRTLSDVLATHGEVLAAVLRFVRDRLVDRWMRTSPLFRPFDDGVRQQIAGRFKFLEVDAGSVLLRGNVKPDGLYIVLAGKFSVMRDGAHLATVGPGELIGETALLSGAKLKSEVVAQGKSLALCLPASDFREMIMTHPHVLEYIGGAENSRKLEIL